MIGTWATVSTAATRFALLLMALRFTGTPDDAIGWPQVFVVYAIVQGLTVLPITAGDAGVSEVAYIGLLTAAAGSQYVNQITAGVLIFRVLTWVAIIPIGLATLAVWQRLMARKSANAPPAAALASADAAADERPVNLEVAVALEPAQREEAPDRRQVERRQAVQDDRRERRFLWHAHGGQAEDQTALGDADATGDGDEPGQQRHAHVDEQQLLERHGVAERQP